jgi:hypothetical protein
LRNKPLWIWDIEEHEQEDIKTNGDCCFNHIIGLPQKDTNDKPLYDYEQIIFDSLFTENGNANKYIWIKKATGLIYPNVCGIELSRDSPTITLSGKKINDQVPTEFPYQPASASSGSQVLMLSEFTLVQSEVDKVNQYLRDHHWTVSAIHNHWFDESPRLIFLHAQKQDNLDNVLNEVRGALQHTNCGCV